MADAVALATVVHLVPLWRCRVTFAFGVARPLALILPAAFFNVRVGAIAFASVVAVAGLVVVVAGLVVAVVPPVDAPVTTSLPYWPPKRWLPRPHQK